MAGYERVYRNTDTDPGCPELDSFNLKEEVAECGNKWKTHTENAECLTAYPRGSKSIGNPKEKDDRKESKGQ